MTPCQVMVGVLAYARPQDLIDTLESVRQQKTPNLRTLVLQSGMSDQEFELVQERHPWATYVQTWTNWGAAGGRNRLIEIALADPENDYLCFLDSDATLAEGAIDTLLDFFPQLESPGLVSCLVRTKERPDEIHSAGVSIDLTTLVDVHHVELPDEPVVSRDAVITTASMVSCQTLHELPPFDERVFAYWEDLDWCVQISRAGFQNYIVRDAVAYHALSRSRFHPAVIYYLIRNKLLIARKLGYRWNDQRLYRMVAADFSHLFRRILALTPLGINALCAGLVACFHGISGRGGIAPRWMRREREQFMEYRVHCAVLAILKLLRRVQ